MLAYTNRFLALATVIRSLHQSHTQAPDPIYLAEISNLRRRINLIRDMQSWGILALILCTTCMFLLFGGQQSLGKVVFGGSIVCMLVSLLLSLSEIRMSVRALDLHLRDIEYEMPEDHSPATL